ncbi:MULTISPECIES: chloramphenicol phosphotransferase CPT family protein [Streptomyces]|uniref:Chloramphenicol phosphotransferase n=1 Tax=Streptomyces wadayamensis TaxID=141454 RepID=A0ABR4S3F1_9ACTN|nr:MULTISPECIES: AAA family ATPase [Streptomyces]KDR60167.1 chloramphenicol phosphotransferase [Streptomyces wadayamensis]QXQ24000.1 chloramphenicol phosphotransferase CPT family protein [Streptomyces albidoflavus]QXQ29924.1 chloramphenicol phosphotransferase CPT family protein [Streptomyces albidoflavus]
MPASEPGPGEARGRIVFLNGTSSAGKSSIAGELVRLLDAPWFVLSADAFHAMRTAPAMGPDQLEGVLRRTWRGFHRAVAGMAAAGNDLVVDHVLSEPWRLRDCLDLFVPEDVVLVGVHCPLPELERRERLRGDRPAGLAARQFSRVHAHGDYDVVVDSGDRSPQECAREIAAFLRRTSAGPTAFTRMRAAGTWGEGP